MAVPSPVISAECELLEAAAWGELHGRFGLQAGSDIATVRRWGRAATLVSRAANIVAVNRAIGFGCERPLDRGQLDDIRTFYREQGKARWFLECSPHARIDAAALADAGGEVGGTQVKLAADLADVAELPMPCIQVVSASVSDGPQFMDLVGAQMGIPEELRYGIVSTIGEPGWHFYFAMADERPVAGAAMFIYGGGAWLGLAGTLPEYRNRGAQTALLIRRMQDARRVGCRWVTAEAFPESGEPNPSLRNMKRLGLRELYQRPWYRFQEDAAPSSTS
ncbi:MAG TPA: GNAT family N-acetyltransferase [Gemmatimonadaceae bacterium]